MARYGANRRPVRGAEQVLLHMRTPMANYFQTRGGPAPASTTSFSIHIGAGGRRTVASQMDRIERCYAVAGHVFQQATREFFRRTERVESILTRENFVPRVVTTNDHAGHPVHRQMLRGARLPASAPPAGWTTQGSPEPAPAAASRGSSPPIELERLTDQVVRAIDRRIAGMRERFGRF